MPPSVVQSLAFDQELPNSVRLIRAGLGQLQNLDGGNDLYHLPLLTLASGFERFMKVILCLRALEVHGEFSGGRPFPTGRDGHNLELLLERIKEACFSDLYLEGIPVTSEDVGYLDSEELAVFTRVLSQFGQAARYYSFDVLLGKTPKTEDPESEWQRLETEILQQRDDLMRLIGAGDASEKIHGEVAATVVAILERFARALSRLFTIGRIGDEAKRYVGYIGGFLHLADGELGATAYDSCGRLF
jgi:hypothetical protein